MEYSLNGNYQSIIPEISCLLGTFLQKQLVGRFPLHVYHYQTFPLAPCFLWYQHMLTGLSACKYNAIGSPAKSTCPFTIAIKMACVLKVFVQFSTLVMNVHYVSLFSCCYETHSRGNLQESPPSCFLYFTSSISWHSEIGNVMAYHIKFKVDLCIGK